MALHSGKSTRLYQWGPGSNPCVETIRGLSLLLVISLTPRGFSLGTPVFPSPQKPTLPNSKFILNARTLLSASWVNKLPLPLQLQTA